MRKVTLKGIKDPKYYILKSLKAVMVVISLLRMMEFQKILLHKIILLCCYEDDYGSRNFLIKYLMWCQKMELLYNMY
ncbi:hypothetical protein Glove_86g147 [Diversispora epigaea]|uniref:Uncharacterized protein n=1 Tax=Diversispora epigaea TaxID=1348612 RepID=A0A397JDA8_9GLOM|nr:hypothetical protein Glove_86g147 [Diversispora epigaea]